MRQERAARGIGGEHCGVKRRVGEGKGERCWPREMCRLEGGAWALRPEEGSMEDLELGYEELGERERKWRKEHGAGGVAMESLCWDCLRDGPLHAGQRRKTAPRGPMAAQCHMEAEDELEGVQRSDGKWWEPEWRSP